MQSIDQGEHGGTFKLSFGTPRKWRNEFTAQLSVAGRFQPVTIPDLNRAGATHFCWLLPGETLTSGPENWVPSSTGAFLYQLDNNQPPIYFPIELETPPVASEADITLVDDAPKKGQPGSCCVLQ